MFNLKIGNNSILEYINDYKFKVSYLSFFQVNHQGLENIINILSDFLNTILSIPLQEAEENACKIRCFKCGVKLTYNDIIKLKLKGLSPVKYRSQSSN